MLEYCRWDNYDVNVQVENQRENIIVKRKLKPIFHQNAKYLASGTFASPNAKDSIFASPNAKNTNIFCVR